MPCRGTPKRRADRRHSNRRQSILSFSAKPNWSGGHVTGIIPQANHRLGPVVFVAQCTQACRTQQKDLPPAGSSPSQREANARRKWPLEKSNVSPSTARTRLITRSARAPAWSGDSPPGQPSRNNCQPGRSPRSQPSGGPHIGRNPTPPGPVQLRPQSRNPPDRTSVRHAAEGW